MTKETIKISDIHNSLVNGQRKQMVKQIEEYGLHYFFEDYKKYLESVYTEEQQYVYFSDAVISYFKIRE